MALKFLEILHLCSLPKILNWQPLIFPFILLGTSQALLGTLTEECLWEPSTSMASFAEPPRGLMGPETGVLLGASAATTTRTHWKTLLTQLMDLFGELQLGHPISNLHQTWSG